MKKSILSELQNNDSADEELLMARFFVFVFTLLLFAPLPVSAAAPSPLRLHAWVDYFPAWLHEEFTRETGIPIVQSFFADNAALHRSIVQDGPLIHYDVVTPSCEMVQQLVAEKLLLKLERSKLPNFKDIDPLFSTPAYDPGHEYSVPLVWGVLGIAIDRRVVPAGVAARIKGYKDLWMAELKGKLLLPYDFRSLMSIMLLTLGYSVNDVQYEHLEEALARLETLAPSVRTFDTVDQMEYMGKPSIGVGVVWGRKTYAIEKDRYTFVFPEEGSPVWVDALAVPKSASNPEAAFAFINFVMRPDVLARLGEEAGYAVAGKEAQALTSRDLRDNPVVYPSLELRRRFEIELMLPDVDDLVKRWNKIREGQ